MAYRETASGARLDRAERRNCLRSRIRDEDMGVTAMPKSSATGKQQICRAVALVLAFVLIGTASTIAAEPPERVPGSAEPLLRVTPVDPERIRPTPTPDLSLPSVPGMQTIVLHDRGLPQKPDTELLAPMVLHLPVRYFRRTSSHPAEMWELALLLLYPSLEPDPGREDRCGRPWCGDELFINVTNGRHPNVHALIENLEATVTHHGDESTAYEVIAPPLGYDVAYIRSFPKDPNAPRRKELLVVRAGRNIRETLGECSLDTPGKLCDFYMNYPGTELKIHYSTRMDNLPVRSDIEAAVLGLVSSFLGQR